MCIQDEHACMVSILVLFFGFDHFNTCPKILFIWNGSKSLNVTKRVCFSCVSKVDILIRSVYWFYFLDLTLFRHVQKDVYFWNGSKSLNVTKRVCFSCVSKMNMLVWSVFWFYFLDLTILTHVQKYFLFEMDRWGSCVWLFDRILCRNFGKNKCWTVIFEQWLRA